mgnify:CR=1 FL=1
MARGRGGVNPQDPLEDTTSEDSGSPTKVEDVDVLQQNGKKNKRKEKGKNAANSNNKKYANKSTINANGSSGAAPTSKRRRKRNRVAHLASIEDEGYAGSSTAAPAIPLPINQYKTTLYRRAIRKRESDSQPPSPSSQKQQQPKKTSEEDDEWSDEEAFEEYGDISLGMKLSVIGGRVIVQNLNSLADGRASPAQISGVIQRGDVLLSIDNLSLVNLPIDLLMERLKPLSTPDSATGAYWRVLHLRFSAGEGLPLLRKYEAAEKRKTNVTQSEEAANEVFSLFPMVDNLSGMPLFDSTTTTAIHSPMPKSQNRQHQEEKKQSDGDVDTPESFKTKELHSSKQQDQQMQIQPLKSSPPTTLVAHHNSTIMDQKSLNEIISNDLAYWRSFDRDKFVSEFFAWNEHYSELLRPNSNFVTAVKEMSAETLTRAEMIELGRKALLGAELLSRNMESIDRGRDNRSFRSWNSSISLRSRASTRRRYVLDAASLPVKFDPNSPLAGSTQQQREGASLATTDEESDDELDEVDGDALLLRLAAHDEIWRNQVIEALEKARDDLNKELEEISEKDEDEEEDTVAQIKAKKDNMDSALTEGLGAFLFGDTMAKIVTKKKKTKALPPEEITAVLFDLSTNLATSMPDEITVSAGTTTGLLKASLVPFAGQKQPRTGSSVILATRFVLNEALVIWLETFRPLPWESRRVLWPHVKRSPTGDESRSAHFSDADSLTCDSPRSAYTSNAAGTGAKKDLRQQIEDQELDLETRAETCFLVTYYFTQRLLPRCAAGDRSYETKTDQAGSQSPEEYNGELVEFVRKYGAYMKLHTCLAYAAALECVDSINELLKLAEHDIRHREVVRLFAKRNALILYEPVSLNLLLLERIVSIFLEDQTYIILCIFYRRCFLLLSSTYL